MLHLLDKNKQNKYPLAGYSELYIESVLKTGDKTLSFSIPINNELGKLIEEEGYIRTKTNEFVIKSINIRDTTKSVTAKLNVEDLEGKSWDRFECVEQTISDCINLALAGTGWTIGICTITKKRTIRKSYCSSWDIIQQARKTYRVEFDFDSLNRKINIQETLGSDKGAFLMDSLNLKKLGAQSNSYDYYTKLIAVGANNLTVTVTNNIYSNKIKTIYWKDERYTIEDSLREDAQAKLDEMAAPYKSYTATPYPIPDCKLGDTITIIDKEKGIKGKWRIVTYREYPEEVGKDSIEIANGILSFIEKQKEFENASYTIDNITSDNGTISERAIKTVVERITINKADIQSLNAVSARVGDLEVTRATITQLNAINANITNLQTSKANITDLTAATGRISILETKAAEIDTLVNGNLTSNNIQSLVLTSDKVTVANGFIKNAMIDSLDVVKINAGTISTNKFTISSNDGAVSIVGATQQFKDKNGNVRIQMGQDTSGNFTFLIKAEDGTTTLIDGYGIKEKAIADKLIKTNMVNDNAIGQNQINYSSFIAGLNSDTNTNLIKSSKVNIDLLGQTLDIAFNSLKTTVDNTQIGVRNLLRGTELKDLTKWTNNGGTGTHLIEIGGGYKSTNCLTLSSGTNNGRYQYVSLENNVDYTLSCWIYVVTAGTSIIGFNQSGKNIDITNAPTGTWIYRTITFKGTGTSIPFYLLANTASYKVCMVKLEKGTKDTDFSVAPEDTDQKIENNTTSITAQQGQINTLISNTTITVDGATVQLKDDYSSLKQTVSGISSTVSSHTSSISSLQTSVSTQASSISQLQTSITQKVTQTDVNNSINSIIVGVRNLLLGTELKDLTRWINNYGTGTHSIELGGGYNGSNCLTLSSGSANGRYQRYTTELNVDYTLSCWVYVTTVGTSIIGFGSSGKNIDISNVPTGTWLYKTITFKGTGTNLPFYLIANTAAFKVCLIKLEKGNKASDHTPAPEDVQTQIDGATTRISSAETKLTATSLTTTISTAINNGSANLSTTQFVMDSTGLTIKNGAIRILNNSGITVLTGDINGNLSITGDFISINGGVTTKIMSGALIVSKDSVERIKLNDGGLTFSNETAIVDIDFWNDTVPNLIMTANKNTYSFCISKEASVGLGSSLQLYDERMFIISPSINFTASKIELSSGAVFQDLIIQYGQINSRNSSSNLYFNYQTANFGGSYFYNGNAAYGPVTCGSLSVTGSKNCIQKTEHYGNLAINAYETAEYYFGDIGSGALVNGKAIIVIDPVFAECIDVSVEYQVFIVAYGKGSIWVTERNPTYFIVEGDTDIKFGWELKAKRKGYTSTRLENTFVDKEGTSVDESIVN